MLNALRHIIIVVIDFFHRPFARWIDKQTFRYLACGGGNMVLYNVLFYVLFEHILPDSKLPDSNWQFWIWTITPRTQAFIIATVISNPIGFLLSRYVVFTESNVRGRVQAFRYGLLVGTCLLLNYAILKVLDEWCHIYAPLASVMTTAIVAVFSYVSQRNFTFKTKEAVIK